MPQLTATITPEADAQRADWVARASALVFQISDWAIAEGWGVDGSTEAISERRIGTYSVPALTIHAPGGEIMVTPVALDTIGRTGGRVDVKAYPTFSRISMLGRSDGTWVIMTDSNVPLRLPWTRQTFVQLVADLLAFT